MITIPPQIIAQLPLSQGVLQSLYNEYGGVPVPLGKGVLEEGLDLTDMLLESPVTGDELKAEAKAFQDDLLEHGDDWAKVHKSTGASNPLYKILIEMQKEIQTLRHDMKAVLDRLDAADEAKYNDARRLVGLPPVKYRHWSEHATSRVPGFSTPTSVERLSVEELCISLEDYLGEEVSEEVPRDTLVRAVKLVAGLEH
ncbi:hypothetical protein Q8F55_007961 [Vanrija albida]|uniref:Uncharacterized protein n=1 Tax=Vanrija albida TaxID=181172 RepID=A0ABR3PV44_9TREE